MVWSDCFMMSAACHPVQLCSQPHAWLYGQVTPSMSATVCITDQGTWLGKAPWALPPFTGPALCTGVFPLKGGFLRRSRASSQTPAPPRTSRQHWELCTPWLGPGGAAPSSTPEENSESMAVFSRQLLPALPGGLETRDISVLPLLCAPHKGSIVTWP